VTIVTTFARRRSTGERVRPGDTLESVNGGRYTYQCVAEPGDTITVHRTGTLEPRRTVSLRRFKDVEWA
jgi:hypothetical protein